MPHCIIEYSSSLEEHVEPDRLVEVVQHGVYLSNLFELSHIRVRAIPFEFCIPGYDAEHFVHVTLRIHAGRTHRQKKQLTGLVLGELNQMGVASVSFSVEVSDIDKATYSRKIS